MSNHLARSHATPTSRRGQLIFMWAFPVLVVAGVVGGVFVHKRWIGIDRTWPSYQGRILDSRLATDHIVNTSYLGGGIIYRLELRVAWTENGIAQSAWLQTPMTSRDGAYLRLFASQHTICTVRRNPHSPGSPIADLDDEWQPVLPPSRENGK
jgi:hypothetical protein